ncbi:hypothetical protein AYI68_g5089 [Smittium mucronatum]|uniref:Reverse transcriptase RNase H-like domain-containing protein n=1 Tax=Smittium mucronatum TaxID=133383 RepID=A0A1R0GV76_9FUNG|nr:hypothetical protein AYI68_g5089 [Smittium mucronatum]
MEIFTDSSDTAWAIVAGPKKYSGICNQPEEKIHINSKELLVVLYSFRLKCDLDRSVLVYLDNTTTLAYLRIFGGTTPPPPPRTTRNNGENMVTLLENK